jgi:hypothetical protein
MGGDGPRPHRRLPVLRAAWPLRGSRVHHPPGSRRHRLSGRDPGTGRRGDHRPDRRRRPADAGNRGSHLGFARRRVAGQGRGQAGVFAHAGRTRPGLGQVAQQDRRGGTRIAARRGGAGGQRRLRRRLRALLCGDRGRLQPAPTLRLCRFPAPRAGARARGGAGRGAGRTQGSDLRRSLAGARNATGRAARPGVRLPARAESRRRRRHSPRRLAAPADPARGERRLAGGAEATGRRRRLHQRSGTAAGHRGHQARLRRSADGAGSPRRPPGDRPRRLQRTRRQRRRDGRRRQAPARRTRFPASRRDGGARHLAAVGLGARGGRRLRRKPGGGGRDRRHRAAVLHGHP